MRQVACGRIFLLGDVQFESVRLGAHVAHSSICNIVSCKNLRPESSTSAWLFGCELVFLCRGASKPNRSCATSGSTSASCPSANLILGGNPLSISVFGFPSLNKPSFWASDLQLGQDRKVVAHWRFAGLLHLLPGSPSLSLSLSLFLLESQQREPMTKRYKSKQKDDTRNTPHATRFQAELLVPLGSKRFNTLKK